MAIIPNDATAAIILAGELAPAQNRLFPAGPRLLLTLGHSNWLRIVLEQCIQADVTSIALCVHDLNPRLVQELRDWVNRIDLRVLVDCVPRGSAGCCRDAIDQFASDTFLAIEGSTLPRFDLRELVNHHHAEKAALTLAVSPTDDPKRARPVGVSVIDRESIQRIPTVGFHDLKEGLITRMLAEQGKSVPWMVARECPRIRDLGSYLDAQRFILVDSLADGVGTFETWCSVPQVVSNTEVRWPGVEFLGSVLVSESARIESGTTLVGPSVIGPSCIIDSGAVVAGCVVRERSRIGPGAIVRQSLLLPGSVINAGVEIDREIVLDAA